MPVRDEEAFIGKSLGAVLSQDYPPEHMEVLLVDGMSSDGTVEQASKAAGAPLYAGRTVTAARGHAVTLLENPRHTTPTSLNLALERAKGDVLLRVDGHCEVAPDYVRRCVEVLASSGADCVGGVCVTVGLTHASRLIARAQSSRFGVGNVAFRVHRAWAGPADTVPFGAYPRQVFDRIGRFDEELVRNQDDELNFRLVQAGGRIWYDPSIRSTYFSRSTLAGLWRQYFGYGLYKVRVGQKRGGFSSPRHLVPPVFVGATVLSAILTLATGKPRWLALGPAPYLLANLTVSARLSDAPRDVPVVAGAFCALHFAYGCGFLAGLWRWRAGFRRRPGGTGRLSGQ
jgi:glycosyltransferase involved in cell wall biosynthesis